MIILWEESNAENSYLLLSVLWMKDGNPSKGNQQSKQTEKENNSNMASKLLQVQKKHSSKNELQSFTTEQMPGLTNNASFRLLTNLKQTPEFQGGIASIQALC